MFNPVHLLNGIAFAHGMNEQEKKKGSGSGDSLSAHTPAASPELPHEAIKQLHTTLLQHHLNQMAHHAKAIHVLTGGKQ